MAVPTTGSFLMFGTGSNATIAGAIIEGGANAETVASTLNFNTLKGLANINKFDAEFKEGATTLEEIVKTIQFRGYPTTGSITTTTTTTLAPTGCYEWEIECFGETGCLVQWTDCNGNNQSISIANNNSGSVCARPTPTISEGTVTLLGNCPTTTTTTIAPTTTTTTTTVAPCSLTLYFNTSAIPSPGGWDTQTEACEGTGTMLTVYTTGPTCPTTFNEVFNDGKALYTNSSLTTLLDGNDKWFKDTSSPNSGQAIQIGSDGFINQIGVCITTTTTTTTTTAAPTTTTTTTQAPTTTTTTTAAPTTTTTTTEGPLYYTLNSCSPGDPLYDTTITPILASQRYVDPISGNFWVWDNNAGTSSPQQTVNNSLQIVSGQSGCP